MVDHTNSPDNNQLNIRPIYTRNALVIHRDPGDATLYTLSHQHTGKPIVFGLKSLRTAYDFLQAFDRVFDFDSLKAGDPQPNQHQKWLIHHIMVQAQRCRIEGWFVSLDHYVRDYDWRTEAAKGGQS